jgi:signal transduction histidine kinase
MAASPKKQEHSGMAEAREPIEVAPNYLSLMAHELSQPLTAALNSVVTLRDRKVDEGVHRVSRADLINIAIRNLEQLQALLESLSVFSELEAGSLMVHKAKVPVADLFREAEENFGTPSSGTKISFACEPGLEVNVELRLFRQVLSNVIGNAGKFSPAGTQITVEAHKTDTDSVVFTVSDEGPGVPPEETTHIFERAVRLQPEMRGLGLGLFVAMAIIIAHGGRIWVENIDGGARFSVEVPTA